MHVKYMCEYPYVHFFLNIYVSATVAWTSQKNEAFTIIVIAVSVQVSPVLY